MRIALSIAATVVACVVLTALVSAQQTVNNVYACVQQGNVRIVAVAVAAAPRAGTCTRNETLISWAIVGPAGVAGPAGAAGATGATGAAGAGVTFGGYFVGNQNGCPNGGAMYLAGGVPAYVCNGSNATDSAVRAAGPCWDDVNRYVDCGNGTVTDTVTGLIWLKQADCLGAAAWTAANHAAAGLKAGDCGLADGSSPGDWRLPTKDEWSATIATAVALGCTSAGAPSMTNDAGTTCYGDGSASSFAGVGLGGQYRYYYWSSSALEPYPPGASYVGLDFGYINGFLKVDALHVWPVRSGSR
ncbi:MAG: DUF1566 domain-containing protein [Vicinamibacterales bacterium]